MALFFWKGINFLLGKWAFKNKVHITSSLNYLQRNRKIDVQYFDYIRLATLELLSTEIKKKQLVGAVAELGVYKGKFAKYINTYFEDYPFYLFDTYEGFDARDISTEKKAAFSSGDQDFSNTSIQKVLSIMPYPKNCIVKKGYFPDTTVEIEEQFCFVSIDTDLYEPIYKGLVYFYPRLVAGGYIMIHDFNNEGYKGAREAVEQYCSEHSIHFTPIPDSCGTAIITK
jgi:O-methyltransferase